MAFLYFKNTTTTGVWNDVTNWFTDDACTTQAANVPWVAGDSTYLGYDLTRSSASVTAEDPIYIDADIGDALTITGTCDIGLQGFNTINNNSGVTIYGGTWSGNTFVNAGIINGGAFIGDSFLNDVGATIYGGTFSGSSSGNNNVIYGGTFSGNTFQNAGTIYGGTFSGSSFSNNGGGTIYGGKFSGASFSNAGVTYGGLFDTTTGLTMPIGSGGVLFDFTLLSASLFLGGISWSSGPWYEDYECSVAWTGDVPWTTSTTVAKNILRGNNIEVWNNPGAVSIDTAIGQSLTITGTCYITQAYDGTYVGDILNNSSIYGGTFAGDFFYNSNYGVIYGGTFSGGDFTNSYGAIYGGTFSGADVTNNYTIYEGTFSGDNFYNDTSGLIFGGTFSGANFYNGEYIYGGTFSGVNFGNNDTIFGGIFTGNNFINYNTIYNGTFSGDSFNNSGSINGGIFTGNGFYDVATIFGGFWLESGFLDIDIFDYTNGGPTPTITGQIRIEGVVTNPYPLDLAAQQGFMTLKIKGQDVLGGGLL